MAQIYGSKYSSPMDPIFGYNFHSTLQNTEQLLEKIKLLQGVVEERRLLQTYGFPFVEGPCFKKDLMVPRHMPIPTGIHSPSENGSHGT